MLHPSAYPIDFIRAQFPALSSGFVYLDNAGGSLVLGGVADRVRDYLLTSSVQLGASYIHSVNASDKVLSARRSVAELIHASDDREVVIGAATTALMFQLVQAILPSVKKDDVVIVTNSDHEANIGAWLRLQSAGAEVRFWNVRPDTLELHLDDLSALLTPAVTWVAMTAASNVLGTVNPIADVAHLVHACGGKLCVDAVAYAPHRLVDVQAMGADVVAFSFYKVFGPHQAVLWGRARLLRELASLNHYFIADDEIPYKLQPGNVNFELSFGCAGIADYLVAVAQKMGIQGTRRQCMQGAFDAFEAHEAVLAERLLTYLRSKNSVRIVGQSRGDSPRRVPTVSFVVEGRQSAAIVRQVDAFGIGIRFGDFYARRLIESLGLNAQGGVVRVSIAHYNTLQEIDRLIEALEHAAL
jgi:cysteine desulfurase family protein (TIGR01976 family)